MKPEEFVRVVKSVVFDATIEDTKAELQRPSGRRPKAECVELSAWFNGLPSSDREMVLRAVRSAAHHAVFGFFAVLDGVRAIEGVGPKGELRLTISTTRGEFLLSASDGPFLHDIFNEEISKDEQT